MKYTLDINGGLDYLSHLPPLLLWGVFFVENLLITVLVLFLGKLIQQKYRAQHVVAYVYTAKEWWICSLTNLLNTMVTYMGFWLWKHGYIHIDTNISWTIAIDFLLLFFAMDLLMFIFHVVIHKTFLYRVIHRLHHQAINPKPIDLFVLHPLETISFGGMWLIVLMPYTFNIYAIITYLVINVLFGLMGHLGIEPLPLNMRNLPLLKFLGTSTFHHGHHRDEQHNFGFYTNIWDRMFGTYRS